MVSVPPLFHFLAFLRLRLFEACSKSLQSTHNMLLHSTGADMKFLGRFVICFFLKITQFQYSCGLWRELRQHVVHDFDLPFSLIVGFLLFLIAEHVQIEIGITPFSRLVADVIHTFVAYERLHVLAPVEFPFFISGQDNAPYRFE